MKKGSNKRVKDSKQNTDTLSDEKIEGNNKRTEDSKNDTNPSPGKKIKSNNDTHSDMNNNNNLETNKQGVPNGMIFNIKKNETLLYTNKILVPHETIINDINKVPIVSSNIVNKIDVSDFVNRIVLVSEYNRLSIDGSYIHFELKPESITNMTKLDKSNIERAIVSNLKLRCTDKDKYDKACVCTSCPVPFKLISLMFLENKIIVNLDMNKIHIYPTLYFELSSRNGSSIKSDCFATTSSRNQKHLTECPIEIRKFYEQSEQGDNLYLYTGNTSKEITYIDSLRTYKHNTFKEIKATDSNHKENILDKDNNMKSVIHNFQSNDNNTTNSDKGVSMVGESTIIYTEFIKYMVENDLYIYEYKSNTSQTCYSCLPVFCKENYQYIHTLEGDFKAYLKDKKLNNPIFDRHTENTVLIDTVVEYINLVVIPQKRDNTHLMLVEYDSVGSFVDFSDIEETELSLRCRLIKNIHYNKKYYKKQCMDRSHIEDNSNTLELKSELKNGNLSKIEPEVKDDNLNKNDSLSKSESEVKDNNLNKNEPELKDGNHIEDNSKRKNTKHRKILRKGDDKDNCTIDEKPKHSKKVLTDSHEDQSKWKKNGRKRPICEDEDEDNRVTDEELERSEKIQNNFNNHELDLNETRSFDEDDLKIDEKSESTKKSLCKNQSDSYVSHDSYDKAFYALANLVPTEHRKKPDIVNNNQEQSNITMEIRHNKNLNINKNVNQDQSIEETNNICIQDEIDIIIKDSNRKDIINSIRCQSYRDVVFSLKFRERVISRIACTIRDSLHGEEKTIVWKFNAIIDTGLNQLILIEKELESPTNKKINIESRINNLGRISTLSLKGCSMVDTILGSIEFHHLSKQLRDIKDIYNKQISDIADLQLTLIHWK